MSNRARQRVQKQQKVHKTFIHFLHSFSLPVCFTSFNINRHFIPNASFKAEVLLL